ncbi:type II toxin-antitoxin system VapC family toxin [Fulvimarina endophytica]|uniref:Type II toxin-antitoxin system VapC family toxin n=1 Tax=Fulvimarina endophytica TaxID=2293836 RepID=A0A371X0F5_9HYPH|nr:type II toxin-antitoxin system VapC family toxin [Fulvimarina endophytica]RFC62689.1 type II toxin-antitoxin system VapC family toxin [Fulvimarina endophytica]
MTSVLLDTHAWTWSLTGDARFSSGATAAVMEAEAVFVSAISLFEIGQKVRLRKWPEMEPFLHRLIDLAAEQGAHLIPISSEASLLAATLEWAHRDPFDRIIAATTMVRGLTLISADTAFDALPVEPKWPGRIW